MVGYRYGLISKMTTVLPFQPIRGSRMCEARTRAVAVTITRYVPRTRANMRVLASVCCEELIVIYLCINISPGPHLSDIVIPGQCVPFVAAPLVT